MDADDLIVVGKTKAYKRKKHFSNALDIKSSAVKKIDRFEEGKLPSLDYLGIKSSIDLFEGDVHRMENLDSAESRKNINEPMIKSPHLSGLFCSNMNTDFSSRDGEIQTYKRKKHSSNKDVDGSLPISVNISGIDNLDVEVEKIKSHKRRKGSSNILDLQASVIEKNDYFEWDGAELPNLESKRKTKHIDKAAIKDSSVLEFCGINDMDVNSSVKDGKIRTDKRKKSSSGVDDLNSLETENESIKTKEKRKRDKSYHSEDSGPPKKLHTSPEKPFIESTRKLLILDVNGILVDILQNIRTGYKADMKIKKNFVFKRPFCDGFIQFCFQNFDLGVWSSRTKENLDKAVHFLFGDSRNQLLFCWDQFHCTNTGLTTPENRSKPVFLKELKKLWENNTAELPWKKGFYNESNTLLLDDSPYKALLNPPHTAIFPPPYMYDDCKDDSLGPGGDLRVYLEGLAMSENVQKYIEKNPFGQSAMCKDHKHWSFYQKDIQDHCRGTCIQMLE